MVKKLAALGYVSHALYKGVRLTDDGRRVALEVLRHHRLLETFLVEELGLPWDRVHAEAEVLEHVLSEGLEARIAARLGDPTHDPHGDPIPALDGTIDEPPTASLEGLSAGSRGRFVRVSDSDPALLQELARLGIRPGEVVEVVKAYPSARIRCGAKTPHRACRAGARDARRGRRVTPSRLEAAPDLAGRALPGEAATIRAAQEALDGERHGLRALWPFLGPAFIASVAYLDPGNFATDIAGGAKYGYLLLWAVLASNLMAMLVQTLSAKLGIATGRNLAEVCRDELPRRVSFGLWVQAEVIAMATDLAEVLGAALGLSLLFGIPLGWGAAIAVAAAFAILALQASGFRRLEAVIAGFVGVIVIAFAFELIVKTPDPSVVADHLFSPEIPGGAILIAVGIVGATVMPHVIYLHSALTQSRVRGRTGEELKKIQRFERIDVLIAMTIAGFVNLAMLSIFAANFFGTSIESIEDAYHGLQIDPGRWAAVMLGVALLAAGLSSSSVGTMAGQIVMQGFIRRRIPIFARRAITAAPALVVALIGVDPTHALVLSQVVLSFGIPFALVPLVLFTSRRSVMGDLVNGRTTNVLAWTIAAVISGLNVFLVVDTFR